MKQNYVFLLLMLCYNLAISQTHTHVYSRSVGGSAWAGPVNEMTNFTTCQETASLEVRGYNWAGWAVTYDVEVNGTTIASDLDGTFTYDLSAYLPVQSVKLIATSGAGWIEMIGTLTITTSAQILPMPTAGSVSYQYGDAAQPLSAYLTGTGTALKWYRSATGDVASYDAPIPDSSVPGITTYYVSQEDASGCESLRIPVSVSVDASNVAFISPSQCGSTLSNVNSYVYATLVPRAQAYRFRVTNNATGEVAEKDMVLRHVMISTLANYRYGDEYSVQVAVKKNGVWGSFGPACTIYAPTPVSTISEGCYGTVSRNTRLTSTLIRYATGYMYGVYNLVTGTWQEIPSVLRTFSFASVDDFQPGHTYSIYVAVRNTDGTYLPMMHSCEVTAEGELTAPLRETAPSLATETFTVNAFPNPFSDHFAIDMPKASDGPVSVSVFNLLGNLVEQQILSVSDWPSATIGRSLAPGSVYLVTVSQNGNSKTLRMVKR